MMVRVKFAKYGPLRFTGHLDVLRFFQKAIRRAGLDVVYTHGFNPHQVMSFAAPLGVGLCSVGEYMDVEIASSDGAEDFKERLQEACPYGIDILSVKMLPEKAGILSASRKHWIREDTKCIPLPVPNRMRKQDIICGVSGPDCQRAVISQSSTEPGMDVSW